ncbi:GntR family transcriptional regulator [Amycolatopsis sp. Poz14]|nr:GntR family transcriptional regulator [Amycolatopsis sp. Poz14]
MLQPHRRQQLSEETATYVRELILSGQVRPGEFVRIDEVGEAVGVSNTPVREGLFALCSEGFVEKVPRRGFVVASFSQKDVRDLFWTQAHLSSELAARAARRITSEELDRIDAINDEFNRAVDAGDDAHIAQLGHAFHREINRAADARRIALILGAVMKQLPNRFYVSIDGQVESSRWEHPELIDALRGRKVRKARELAETHILSRAETVIDMLAERGLWAA